jgi:hypothetical protein
MLRQRGGLGTPASQRQMLAESASPALYRPRRNARHARASVAPHGPWCGNGYCPFMLLRRQAA